MKFMFMLLFLAQVADIKQLLQLGLLS